MKKRINEIYNKWMYSNHKHSYFNDAKRENERLGIAHRNGCVYKPKDVEYVTPNMLITRDILALIDTFPDRMKELCQERIKMARLHLLNEKETFFEGEMLLSVLVETYFFATGELIGGKK